MARSTLRTCEVRLIGSARWRPGPLTGAPLVAGAPRRAGHSPALKLGSGAGTVANEAIVLAADVEDGGTATYYVVNPAGARAKPSLVVEPLLEADDGAQQSIGVRAEVYAGGRLALGAGAWRVTVMVPPAASDVLIGIDIRIRGERRTPPHIAGLALERRVWGGTRAIAPDRDHHAWWILGLLAGARRGRRFDDGEVPTLAEISRRVRRGPTWARDRVDAARLRSGRAIFAGTEGWVEYLLGIDAVSDATIDEAFELFRRYASSALALDPDPRP